MPLCVNTVYNDEILACSSEVCYTVTRYRYTVVSYWYMVMRYQIYTVVKH